MERFTSLSAALIAVALLSACSAAGEQAANPTLPVTAITPARVPADLFVSDLGNRAVEILKNRRWKNIGDIPTGYSTGPDRSWVDKLGNLYVTIPFAKEINEYAPGTTTPSFTYSAKMQESESVATDKHGNVYEGDVTGHFVNEYQSNTNSVLATCSPGGEVLGVAIDARGDVFLSVYVSSIGEIVEYARGLSGCNETVLGLPVSFPTGMAFDSSGNLLVCDELKSQIDVVAPPFTSATSTLGSGWLSPFSVTINKKNTQAYVDDVGNGFVRVLNYPSGTLVATLGSANGLSSLLYGAVDGQNYVP